MLTIPALILTAAAVWACISTAALDGIPRRNRRVLILFAVLNSLMFLFNLTRL